MVRRRRSEVKFRVREVLFIEDNMMIDNVMLGDEIETLVSFVIKRWVHMQ